MNALFAVQWPFSETIVERLGWVLVHSLWQFAVLGLVAAIFLGLLRHSTSTARHGLLVFMLAAAVMVPVATWLLQPASHSQIREPVDVGEHPRSDVAPATTDFGNAAPALPADTAVMPESKAVEATTIVPRTAVEASLRERISHTLEPWFPWIVGGWCVGVLLCSLRPLIGWRMLRRLRKIGISAPSDEVLAAFERVSQRLGLRRAVEVLYSTLAKGPLVLGYFRPVVLLPVSLVASIPVSQLEAILAHELAHVRRHDFIINLLQTLIETLFFYHPAIWWLSHRIRIQREHCCDDLVVKLFNNRAEYGRALIAVELLQGRTTSLALGATDGSLLARIRRIVGVTRGREMRTLDRGLAALLSLGSLGVIVLMLVFSWTASAQVATEISGNAKSGNVKEEKATVVETHQAIKATSGGPTFVLPDHRSMVTLWFTADGKSLVSVSHEKAPDRDAARFAIRTWDVAEKRLTREVELEWDQDWNRSSGSMTLSKDCTKVISSLGGQIGIWDADTGKLVKRLEPPAELQKDALLRSVAGTPDMSLIASGRSRRGGLGPVVRDAHAIVWDANTGHVVRAITLKHAYHVKSLALSVDGKRLATLGMQNGADVWEVSSGKLLLDFRNANPDRKHPDPEVKGSANDLVLDVALSPDGKLLATSDMLGVKLTDVNSGKLVQRIDAPYRYDSGGRSLVFSADGQLLARLGTCMKLGESPTERVTPIWSTQTGRLMMSLPIDANCGSFSDDGKWFAVGLSDLKEAVAVWQIRALER